MGDVPAPLQTRGPEPGKYVGSYGEKTSHGATSGREVSITSGSAGVADGIVQLPEDWKLSERELCDLELLLTGALAPLNGFMTREEYDSVVDKMTLPNGDIFPLPVVLAIPKTAAISNAHWVDSSTSSSSTSNSREKERHVGKVIALRDSLGTIVAELTVADIYEPDIHREMEKCLGTTDSNHPYVEYLKSHHASCWYVGGRVSARTPFEHFNFADLRKTPSQVKELIKKNGSSCVVGFQTRNPMHCSHFALTVQSVKQAESETASMAGTVHSGKAMLLLTPAIGPTQPGDVDVNVRVRCYRTIMKRYAAEKVSAALVLLPLAMRMAGPREALLHALIRRNYGCTHFIVGRDHAGPSSKRKDGKPFYEPYEAQEVFEKYKVKLGISPLIAKSMCYVGSDKGGYVQENRVPQGCSVQNISGTELREMLTSHKDIPTWYSFPEVVAELRRYYKAPYECGLVVYFTGLPCSGKSTLSKALEARLLERSSESRNVTLLDADVIRQYLSKGLGFSKEDRSVNVRRIGYVASEIAKHRGICLVANIAPYRDDRIANRVLIEAKGAKYVECYVSTPLEVCESRDVKDLFKKARQGIVKQFTGISDPYEVPTDAEITVNSSSDLQSVVDSVVSYLQSKSYLAAVPA